jgi:hypothetical protein
MDRQESFDTLQLHNHAILDKHVDPITAIEMYGLVQNRQRNLSLESQAGQRKFVTETLLIC